MAKAKPKPESDAPPEDMSAVEWARAVLWACENVKNTRMTARKAGSKLRLAYWQLGRENINKLAVDLAPKAASILDKNKPKEEASDVIEAENLAIAELNDMLQGALEEAGL